MENHPIPQDITGFQFKLIGDMTIKQFAYLAAGIVLGWIFFALLPYTLLKILVGGTFAASGFAAAFLPVAGRPLDTMIINYIKALFAPTQYVYQKEGVKIWFPETHRATSHISYSPQPPSYNANEKLKQYLSSIPQKPKNKYDERELSFFQSLSNAYSKMDGKHSFLKPTAPAQTQPRIITAVTKEENRQEKEIARQNETKAETFPSQTVSQKKKVQEENPFGTLVLEKKLQEAKNQEKLEKGTAKYEEAHKKVLELEKLLHDVQSRKLALENQIQELQKKLKMQNLNVMTPGVVTPKLQSQTVKKVPPSMTRSTGAPLIPDVPNLVSGVIKDPRGNPLSNILVEIKDAHGNPVRAFKTNIAGQFASATPLINGTYTISFEDPKSLNKFDQIEISATGEIMLPLEVISVDAREELRRSLFELKN